MSNFDIDLCLSAINGLPRDLSLVESAMYDYAMLTSEQQRSLKQFSSSEYVQKCEQIQLDFSLTSR